MLVRPSFPGAPFVLCLAVLCLAAPFSEPLPAQTVPSPDTDVALLVAAMLGDTPLVDDLRALTREIGGRATGSPANARSVDWGVERFRAAGVRAASESFTMPERWLERSAAATIRGDGLSFEVDAAAMPFSTATPPEGVSAPLIDLGFGTEDDFARVGTAARDAFLLVETHPLEDIDGLFREYAEAYEIELRAAAVGARGVAYMGSRAPGNLYRHNSSLRGSDARPMVILERTGARRALDLIRGGHDLALTVRLDLDVGGPYESFNVIAEIPGADRAEQVVVIGAHLDSWDIGEGALDNGANVAIVIDLARQMRRLGIRPARTIRFALWNGEEQGLNGSWGYVKTHASELDGHVMAMSLDIGCGLINGFFTGGRPEVMARVESSLEPVRGLGPFTQIDVPIVGTDNYDFMMEGVANLVGNHEPATYGPNYHAMTDRFEACDTRSVRLNGAIAAAVVLGFANGEATWGRQSRAEVERLIATTDLESQMRNFNVWEEWASGERGRRR
jgi:hypothetical protein